MPLTIKHSFTSPKLDGPDPTVVRPSNWNDEHEVTGGGFMLAGTIIDFVGVSWPAYMLECYGQSVSAATYPLLFAAMVKQFTVTFTLGTPGIVNWTSHGVPVNGKVRFQITSGTLPTGIVANTDYYALPSGYSANTFQIAATVGGTAIALSGGSGTYTGIHAPFGVSTDLATFSIPDLRGRVTAGLDIMGGADANRLTGISGSLDGSLLGATGGVEGVTLLANDVPAHTHTVDIPSTAVTVTVDSAGEHTHTVTGTVSSAADHTHSGSGGTIGSAGAHTHTLVSGTTDTEAAHGHADTFSIANSLAHTHAVQDGGAQYAEWASYNVSGSGKSLYQRGHESGGSGDVLSALAGGVHTHTLSGAVSSGGAHAHAISTLTVSTVADHTHPVTGLTIAAGGAHSHTFSSGSAASGGAHTHTASGTVDPALVISGSSGAGAAHNNVQPTFIVRKLIYVG